MRAATTSSTSARPRPAAAGTPLRSGGCRRHGARLAAQACAVEARFAGVADRPADTGVDVSKRSGWDSDRDGNVATLPPATETGRDGGSTDKQRNSPPGGGNHRLLLLNSPKHKEPLVVKGLVTVVPNCDEQHARNCHATAQQLGMAIVTSCLKEHAEFYMQQLYRCGIRTAIEPDTTTA